MTFESWLPFGDNSIGYRSCESSWIPCSKYPSVFGRGIIIEKKPLFISRESPCTANQIVGVTVNRSASKAIRRNSDRCESESCEPISKLSYTNGFFKIHNHVTIFFSFFPNFASVFLIFIKVAFLKEIISLIVLLIVNDGVDTFEWTKSPVNWLDFLEVRKQKALP